MAIQWADNFDNYGTDETFLLDGIYAEATSSGSAVSLVADPDVNETGNVIRINPIADSSAPFTAMAILRKIYNGAITTAGYQFRIWLDELPESDNNNTSWNFANVNNEPQISFRILTTGAIEVTRGETEPSTSTGTTGTVLGTTGPVLTAQTWNHVEMKVFLDNSAGTVQLRVNGVTVLNLSGIDTLADETTATIDQMSLRNGFTQDTSGITAYFKDLILWDTTGSQNNDFLGTVHVYTLRPDADNSLNWTPSTGSTGFNLIDESDPDDADYISAGDPPPSPAVFTLTNLPVDIVGVKALLPVVRARKIDGGDGNIQTGLTGTLTDLGADRPITTAFTFWWDVSELSPDTGVAWTPLEVDAAKLQIDRTV